MQNYYQQLSQLKATIPQQHGYANDATMKETLTTTTIPTYHSTPKNQENANSQDLGHLHQTDKHNNVSQFSL